MLPPIQVRMLKECLKCGGGGVQRKKRSATPRSTHFSALLYKSEQWSAELGSDYFTHTHTHTKEEFSLLRKPCKLGSLLQKHLSQWIILTVR